MCEHGFGWFFRRFPGVLMPRPKKSETLEAAQDAMRAKGAESPVFSPSKYLVSPLEFDFERGKIGSDPSIPTIQEKTKSGVTKRARYLWNPALGEVILQVCRACVGNLNRTAAVIGEHVANPPSVWKIRRWLDADYEEKTAEHEWVMEMNVAMYQSAFVALDQVMEDVDRIRGFVADSGHVAHPKQLEMMVRAADVTAKNTMAVLARKFPKRFGKGAELSGMFGAKTDSKMEIRFMTAEEVSEKATKEAITGLVDAADSLANANRGLSSTVRKMLDRNLKHNADTIRRLQADAEESGDDPPDLQGLELDFSDGGHC